MDNLEIQQNKYISRSLVNCLSGKLNMDIHEDTGFLTNHFEPSSERGNFSNRAKYGDIPSSHGDIPVVFCLIHGIGLLATTGFSKFLPTGSIILVAPSFEDAGFSTCTFFTFGFSSTRTYYLFWDST